MISNDEIEAWDEEWRRLNWPFEENDHRGPANGSPWLIENSGSRLRVVVAAVHAVRHNRPGCGLKAADANTGGLSRVLGHMTGACAVAVLRENEPGGDANWAEVHPLKAYLGEQHIVDSRSLLLDLHGMTKQGPADLILGAGGNESLVEDELILLEEAAQAVGLETIRAEREGRMRAFGSGTMTAWARTLGAKSIQIEIAKDLRSFRAPRQGRHALLVALGNSLREL